MAQVRKQKIVRGQSKDQIVLEGLFEAQALGTFPVLRGFADLRDLAAISVPFEMQQIEGQSSGATVAGHQRPHDPTHAQDIKSYLESPQRRFMPEIILSVRGWWRAETDGVRQTGLENMVLMPEEIAGIRRYDEATKNGEGGLRQKRMTGDDYIASLVLPLAPDLVSLLSGNDHDLADEILDPTITIGSVSRDKDDMRHTLAVARRDLEFVRSRRLVRRIDGNHRLALAEQLTDDKTEPTRYRASFCLVFLGPPGDANDDYEESVIFHTINSTALPLESERALQLILGQSANFSPPATEEWASNRALHLTRLIYRELSERVKRHPRKIGGKLGPRYLSGVHRAARWLCQCEPPLFNDQVSAQEFATRFGEDLTSVVQTELGRFDSWVRRTTVFLEFAALALVSTRHTLYESELFDTYRASRRLRDFWEWVRPVLFMEDDVWTAEQTAGSAKERFQPFLAIEEALNSHPPDAPQLWRLYEAKCARVPSKLFLARWNPGNDHTRADAQRSLHRLEAIQNTIEQLKAEGVYLQLCDIDSRRGGTYPIALEVWREIETSEIMLIDLTGERPNVMLEAGYALKLHPKGRLLFMFHIVNGSEPPSNLKGFDIVTFHDTAEILGKLKSRLSNIARQGG